MAVAGALTLVAFLLGTSYAVAFPPDEEAEMQQAVEQYAAALEYPGIVAGVWQQGQGSYVASTGVADTATDRPPRAHDHARIGSNTKTLTATLVLQLVNRGRLHLADRLSEHVRGIPFGRRITIRELLNHTSGIFTTPSGLIKKFLGRPHHHFPPTQSIRRAVQDHPRYCPPGECFHYSNTNYLLLGEILKRVTHQRLRDLYERRIFDRVGLDDTYFQPRRPVADPAIHGYVAARSGPKDTVDWNLTLPCSAGAATSTLADLRRWAPALATGRRVLSERMQRKRLRTVPMPGTAGARYGLGIMQIGSFFGHDGAVPGYDSFVLYSPSLKMTVAAIGNTSVELDPVRHTPLDVDGLINLAEPLVEAAESQP
jgi:D-alanyl-D-alanine carboxypeptidase